MGDTISRVGDALSDILTDEPEGAGSHECWSPGLRAVLTGCTDPASTLYALRGHWRARKCILEPIILEARSVNLLEAISTNDLESIGLRCCWGPRRWHGTSLEVHPPHRIHQISAACSRVALHSTTPQSAATWRPWRCC